MPSSGQVGTEKLELKANSRCTITRSRHSTTVERQSGISKPRSETFWPKQDQVCSFFNGTAWSAIKNGVTDLSVDGDGNGSITGTKELPEGLRGWFKAGEWDGGWDDATKDDKKNEEKHEEKKKEGDTEEKERKTGGNERQFSEGEEAREDDTLYRSGVVAGGQCYKEEGDEPTESEKSEGLASLRPYIVNSNADMSHADTMSESMYVPM
jgi:hypothetical protein